MKGKSDRDSVLCSLTARRWGGISGVAVSRQCEQPGALRHAGTAQYVPPERLTFSQRLHCFVSATPPVFPPRVMRTLQSEHDIRIFHPLVRQYWKMKLSVSDPMAKPRDTQSRYISFGLAHFH